MLRRSVENVVLMKLWSVRFGGLGVLCSATVPSK